MTRSPELLPSDQPAAISQLLHTALIAAQSKHPNILTEPCRKWLLNASPEAQISKISALINQQSDSLALLKAVDHILDQTFIPAFKGSNAHHGVLQRVKALMTRSVEAVEGPGHEANKTSINQSSRENDGPISTVGAGLLLVDAENMNPPEALENALETVGQYPIRYRLAFGNWRKLGERDQELYRRGYQMVHVPSGKNSADIKMSLDAFLISLRNPSIREVFICSTDSDLLHLGHALLNLGIIPYRISQHNNDFAVLNIETQASQIVPGAAVLSTVAMPTLAQIKRWLQILVMQEQQANPGKPITVAQLGKLFYDRNQISANQALQANSDYKTLKKFLEAHDVFVLKPLPDNDQLEVTLKVSTEEPAQPTQLSEQSAVTVTPLPITNAHTLEQALIKLLWGLSPHHSGGSIRLSVLSTHFAQVHKEPLSQALKRVGEPKGLPKFMAKCRSLRAQRKGKEWWVALACVS